MLSSTTWTLIGDTLAVILAPKIPRSSKPVLAFRDFLEDLRDDGEPVTVLFDELDLYDGFADGDAAEAVEK